MAISFWKLEKKKLKKEKRKEKKSMFVGKIPVFFFLKKEEVILVLNY